MKNTFPTNKVKKKKKRKQTSHPLTEKGIRNDVGALAMWTFEITKVSAEGWRSYSQRVTSGWVSRCATPVVWRRVLCVGGTEATSCCHS